MVQTSRFRAAGAFVLYLVLAAAIGLVTARLFRLPPAAARTLFFSVGTRNSFVVLPLVLALPPGWESAVTVVVLQPLAQLLGMLAYLRWLPRFTAAPAPNRAWKRGLA